MSIDVVSGARSWKEVTESEHKSARALPVQWTPGRASVRPRPQLGYD